MRFQTESYGKHELFDTSYADFNHLKEELQVLKSFLFVAVISFEFLMNK